MKLKENFSIENNGENQNIWKYDNVKMIILVIFSKFCKIVSY